MSTALRAANRTLLAIVAAIAMTVGLAMTARPASATLPSASQVTLARTGGFAGVHDCYVVESTTVHVDTAYLIQLVSSWQFRRLDAAYPASTPGADRFAYTLTVRYGTGRTKTVRTVEGADAPAVLWQAIGLTRQISLDTSPTSTH
ncbi:protealysin inhibitor emfourin [Krasilnikovia sp. MM14-A1004]|uniref:protealysin inhibitor emfourin n=1 Tax=Krasilnikovia sp. MM14-A1004 TaxID=3373541 RepID=UPI00399C79F1